VAAPWLTGEAGDVLLDSRPAASKENGGRFHGSRAAPWLTGDGKKKRARAKERARAHRKKERKIRRERIGASLGSRLVARVCFLGMIWAVGLI
jgi:hypothetical protein